MSRESPNKLEHHILSLVVHPESTSNAENGFLPKRKSFLWYAFMMTFRKELNILMLGGQSSIGQSILSKLPSNCHILATSRSNSELKVNKSGTEWINLDIANENSIELFLDEISYTSFDLIINLIGKLSGLKSKSSLKLISDYLQIYISNQTFLIERLFAINSKIEFSYINISSRAVTYGSNDLYYSEAKSAIHGLTKSLAR